jgi:hypothetical protein
VSKYDERTVREWFVKGTARGDIHTAEDEQHAREI